LNLSTLLARLAELRIAVFYDGQHVRLRPADLVDEDLREAVKAARPALVWLCLNRMRPDELRPAWEFWLPGERWIDYLVMKERLCQSGKN
jgi:hypothetical protein